MKLQRYFLTLTFLVVQFSTLLVAAEVDLPLDVTNGGTTKNMFFGLDPAATDGRDAALGENELPPLPPSGIFDARFTLAHVGFPAIQGLLRDYRRGSSSSDTVKVHRIKLQWGTGTTFILFQWNLPSGATGVLRDLFGGVIINVNMTGSGSYSLTNQAFTDLEMVVTYTAPLPVQLSSFTAFPTGNNVQLDWTTVSETNNYGFEVQKSSDPSGNFASIANSFVPGHGTTIEPHNYSYLDQSVEAGTWYYRLKQLDLDGTVHYTDAIHVDILADAREGDLPLTFALEQNYPNPFNPTTTIHYSLPVAGVASLKVYNLIGQEVAVLVNEHRPAGRYSFVFDASNLTSGVYYYKLSAADHVQTRKLVLVK